MPGYSVTFLLLLQPTEYQLHPKCCLKSTYYKCGHCIVHDRAENISTNHIILGLTFISCKNPLKASEGQSVLSKPKQESRIACTYSGSESLIRKQLLQENEKNSKQ